MDYNRRKKFARTHWSQTRFEVVVAREAEIIDAFLRRPAVFTNSIKEGLCKNVNNIK
jgi:hypothetical protein